MPEAAADDRASLGAAPFTLEPAVPAVGVGIFEAAANGDAYLWGERVERLIARTNQRLALASPHRWRCCGRLA